MEPDVLDATEVARLLRVNPATFSAHLDDMVKQQHFPAPRSIGRLRRWSRRAVLDWLAGEAAKRATSSPRKRDALAVIDAL
jgi:predicted DNA-binding transcriptional regulator AlpA